MKALAPVLLALVGLGAGVGAGLALKPAPTDTSAALSCDESSAGLQAEDGAAAQGTVATPAADCVAEELDPYALEAHGEKKPAEELAYVPMDKPFVVPVFVKEQVVAMVIMSVSGEADEAAAHTIEAVKPRLRDSFLKAMFRHANSGGFDGSFTAGPKMEDLKSALLTAARAVLEDVPVEEVLITEIARQDV